MEALLTMVGAARFDILQVWKHSLHKHNLAAEWVSLSDIGIHYVAYVEYNMTCMSIWRMEKVWPLL